MPQDYSLKLCYYLFSIMDSLQILLNTPDTPTKIISTHGYVYSWNIFKTVIFFLAVLTKIRLRLGRKLCSD